jgi:uroporphyrinogen-III synthase
VILLPASLNNKVLAITRKDTYAHEFSQLVSSEGGKTISLPAIDIVPKDPKVVEEFINTINKKKHDYCAFMSSQAVNVLFDLAMKINKTENVISALNSRTIIAVGPKTRWSLINHRIDVKMVPERYSSEGLIKLFSKMDRIKGKRIIIPRSGASKEFVRNSLSDLGMIVDELFLYTLRTSQTNSIWKDFTLLLEQKKVDAIIFTSASTVESFFEIMQRLSHNPHSLLKAVKAIIAIGPLTNEELIKRNIRSLEAKEHTIKGTFDLAKAVLGETDE